MDDAISTVMLVNRDGVSVSEYEVSNKGVQRHDPSSLVPMPTIEEMRAELAGKIQRLKDDGNYPDDKEVCRIVTNFPKHLPPPGIKYSKNFANFQKSGRFALQVK